MLLSENGDAVINDFGSLFCGERLGNGIGREVYEMATDATKVVKIETAARSFQNIAEWELWRQVKDTRHAKWLAPCHHISPCGIILIMDRTEPLRRGECPKRVPDWLTDFHRGNWGMLNGRVVCHDYGYTRLVYEGLRCGMTTPDWKE